MAIRIAAVDRSNRFPFSRSTTVSADEASSGAEASSDSGLKLKRLFLSLRLIHLTVRLQSWQ
jgi:hypothetical protein